MAILIVAVLGLLLIPSAGGHGTFDARAASATVITVTSTGDSGGDDAACPDPVNCTLRKAIEVVNSDDSLLPFIIVFDEAVFPTETPATIAINGPGLPPVTHSSVSIEGPPAGVILDGSASDDGADGLTLSGSGSAVRGMAIQKFSGACLVVRGSQSIVGGTGTGQGNHLGGCAIGLRADGDEMAIVGNTIGFQEAGDTPAGSTGMVITGASVVVGEEGGVAAGNRIGGVATGIRVGDAAAAASSGVRITGNVFGKAADGTPAPLNIGILLRQKSSATTIEKNVISNTTVAAIGVAAIAGGITVTQNTFRANVFEGLGGMAIDLNGDGVRNANDAGDLDSGANEMLNYPVFTRTTQARIAGHACPGCRVELSLVQHMPGGAHETGYQPLPVAVLTADAGGLFGLDSPPVTPGTWISALATDTAGNTSEFSPSARVGAGVIQCANTELARGWNHAGYFGPETVTLGTTVPGDPQGHIRAIYRLTDGTGEYEQWLRDSMVGRTLTTLDPGEAYWFLVDDPVTLPGGFSLNQPLSSPLQAGWNDAVYFGAGADVRDAFASIAGLYSDLSRWQLPRGWSAWGEADTPGWARGFSEADACGAYIFRMSGPGTLAPLQP